jgi:beta-phosphoglucomutase
MKIGAVVFDMDGLMIDTERVYRAAWQQACAELGFVLDDASYALMIGRPTGDCEGEIVRLFGPEFPVAQFHERWPALWRLLVPPEGIARKHGLDTLLAFARQQRLATAVATSTYADDAEFCLRSAGLAGRFDTIVTGDQVAQGKPAPDIYLEAARRLGVHPAECVALEDSDAGVLAASAAGMIPICVPDLTKPSDVTTRTAACVVGSLLEARDWIHAAMTQSGSRGSRP